MGNSKAKGHIFALITACAWGTSFIVSKELLHSVTAIQLIWVRFIIGYIALWILYPKWSFKLREEGLFFLASLFSNTLYFICENTGLKYTQSSNVSILTSTIPIMTALILFFMGKEKLSKKRTLGIIIALMGVVLTVLNGAFYLKLNPLGDLLALMAAVCWSVYSILMGDRVGRYNSFLLSRKLMFYGILAMTPIMLLTDGVPNVSAVVAGAGIWGFLYLGLICSAACYVLWNIAMRELGIMTLNIYLYSMPIFTLIAGTAFLHEKITPVGITGMVLVCAGMILGNRQEETK